MFKTGKKIGMWMLLLLAVYFPVFLHLDSINIYLWDEARNAINAYEMARDGNYFVRYFIGNPDTWETKPPLLIWMQVFFLKVFGYNELAIRMPSALATLGIIALVLRFFFTELKDKIGGIASILVLLTSMGFVRGHVSRSGDHDALLSFFLILALVYFYKYLKDFSRKHILILSLALSAAVLTKSIAGLFFLPGFMVFALYKKKLLKTVCTPNFYLGLMIFISLVGGYYAIAEYQNPGYINLVWDNELLPRFFNSSENFEYTVSSKWYYLTELGREQFVYYLWLLPLSCLFGVFLLQQPNREFAVLLFLTGGIFLATISSGTTNSWYSAPLIPIISMLIGMFLSRIIGALIKDLAFPKPALKELFVLACFVSIFSIPYYTIITEQVYFPKAYGDYERYGDAMKKIKKDLPDLKDYWVYHSVANAQFHFYKYLFNEQYGYEVKGCGVTKISNCENELKRGQKILVCEQFLKQQVRDKYLLKDVIQHNGCMLFEVKGVNWVEGERKGGKDIESMKV